MQLGRLTRGKATALCLVAAGFAFSGTAQAADLGKTLEEGVSLLKRGKNADAAKKFREVLAADPSNDDAYNLVRSTDVKVFLEMLKAGGEAEQVAKRLHQLAHVAEQAKKRDQAAIDALVQGAINGADLGARTEAANKLAAHHGEYAVPALLGFLGSTDTQTRANAILAIRRIGKDAVLPLAAALPTGNDTRKHNVGKLLEALGDERSEPAMLAAGGKTKEAVAAYLAMAKKYFGGDPGVLRNYDGSYVIWTAAGDSISGRDVPAFLYRYELCEQACYDALALDGANADARALIALTACTELSAHDSLDDEAKGAEAIQGAGKALEGARAIAASTGTSDLLRAFEMGMEMGAGGGNAVIAETLPAVWDGRKIDAKNALVVGLTHADKAVRYAAAMALLRIDPDKPFPKSNLVAGLAGQAASEVAVPQVLVIDSDTKNAMNVARALNKGGYHAVVRNSGAGGLIADKATGSFDAVVIRSKLADITTFQVLDEINADFRTNKMVKIVMAEGSDVGAAKADFDKRNIQGVAPTAKDTMGIVNTLKEAMPPDSGDERKARAARQSIMASHSIAGVSGKAFDLRAAQPGLLSALRSTAPENVRLSALMALAHVSGGDAQGRLAEVVANAENSAAVRVGACKAIAGACRGKAPEKKTYDTLLAAMGDADVGVRTAAGAALGACKLDAKQQAEVLNKRRVQ
jgi:CheY-like chemotaxis protein